MSRPLVVSRADLLRLLAVWPDEPLAAARLAGYQPEGTASIYETEPAQAERDSQPVRFWRLHRRERLQRRPTRLANPLPTLNSVPAELRQLRPLSAQELTSFPSPASPPVLRKKTVLPAKWVSAAALLRPLSPQKIVKTTDGHLPTPSVFVQFRAGQLQVDWLELFALRLVRTWFERKNDAEVIRTACALLDLLPEEATGTHDYPSLLYAVVHRDALRHGAVIPPQYQPEAVLRMAQEPLPPSAWTLIQEGEQLFLVNGPEDGLCLLRGSRIAGLVLSADLFLLRRNGQMETVPGQTQRPICSLRGLEQFCLQTQSEKLHVTTCVRPPWAVLVGRTSRDLFADVPWLGTTCRLRWQAPTDEGEGRWRGGHGQAGMDSFGLFAYIGFHGRVMQRFRWIGPGRFLMGSPADEPEREVWGKETLHEVVLTTGFWLAETGVTQELWQFVMRYNPARFRSGARPVDSVSWDDAHGFLQRLNAMVPALNARLPTEAEWEYACRAGTSTPFAFGAQITPDLVNYNGGYPYQGGVKGAFRGQTVPCGSLPANAWGLREMHGNLWEWCHDFWQDDLGGDAAVDPQGPDGGEFCVVRGGSWFLVGKGVRSAVRGRFAPDFRSDRVGFRIACDFDRR
jgi:formylglycine-generating enzyme required for sulfatase activity